MTSGRPADEQQRYEQLFETGLSVSDLRHEQIWSRLVATGFFVVVGYSGLYGFQEASGVLEITFALLLVVFGSLLALKEIDEILCFAVDSHSCNQCQKINDRWGAEE